MVISRYISASWLTVKTNGKLVEYPAARDTCALNVDFILIFSHMLGEKGENSN